jgi:hypothetical protein
MPVVTARVAPAARERLSMFGAMADVGLPDGIIASVAIRPWKWVRVSAGGGSNLVSSGWRTGITLLPFGSGLSASAEYGRFQAGDANPLAATLGFGNNPALDRVGYEYTNLHLGYDLALHSWVFFIHAGISLVRGQIHNLDATIHNATEQETGNTGSTMVVVRQEPSAKATLPSVKLGLAFYVW